MTRVSSLSKHRSLLFQEGHVKDFLTALEVLVGQQQDELRDLLRRDAQYHSVTPIEKEEAQAAITAVLDSTQRARIIYDEIMLPAIRETAARLCATGDAEFIALANAFVTGDYTGLAL